VIFRFQPVHYINCTCHSFGPKSTVATPTRAVYLCGSRLASFQKATVQEEVEQGKMAIEAVGGELLGCVSVTSFSKSGQRLAAVVRKVRDTPGLYPRKNGVPNKRPLGAA
jgi:hypothetical protein